MRFESVGGAAVRPPACGGHSSSFHPLSAATVSGLFSPSHFPSSLCSVTLSLLTLPLSTPPSNALSHHCFSSLPSQPPPPLSSSLSPSFSHCSTPHPSLSPTHTHPFPKRNFTFGGHTFSFFSPTFLYLSPVVSLTLFSWLYNVYQLPTTTTAAAATSIIMRCGKQQCGNASTFFLLQLFIIHCISVSWWNVISLAMWRGGNVVMCANRDLLTRDASFLPFSDVSMTSLVSPHILRQSICLLTGRLCGDYRLWDERDLYSWGAGGWYAISCILLASLYGGLQTQLLLQSMHGDRLSSKNHSEIQLILLEFQVQLLLLDKTDDYLKKKKKKFKK